MNVLIVEDDDGVAEALEQALGVQGYQTRRVGTGAEALRELAGASLVLLDLGLPDLDGHEVCRRIRERSCVPVITLSGRTDELSRVMALHMGADDFIAKPFSRYELVARIQAVLRRARDCLQHAAGAVPAPRPAPAPVPAARPAGPAAPPTPHAPTAQEEARETTAHRAAQPPHLAGPLRLDPRTRKVFLHAEEVCITRREFDLLAMLIAEPGTVMERQEIMATVWDENWFGSTRTLDVHVGSLRSKLGNEWIETVRGVGYRLTVPAAALA
ncbi:response regulator transcription factor [Streptomyces sp. SH5]|uniref:response regulator transcription factor n=1 Tax=Streptomyces sp. SH5 TaxID=3041765 RepID=UPI002477E656|nr:response regulator transcription factor [Streptomyces sp. SH5]WGP09676.1 response regulator transcription factor [Streptomyces sp. SH5]